MPTSQRRTHRPDGYPARGAPIQRMGPRRWSFFSSLLREARPAMREVLWERLKRTEIEQAAKAGAVAIIPIASLEQHANHLPVNTDSNLGRGAVRSHD